MSRNFKLYIFVYLHIRFCVAQVHNSKVTNGKTNLLSTAVSWGPVSPQWYRLLFPAPRETLYIVVCVFLKHQ